MTDAIPDEAVDRFNAAVKKIKEQGGGVCEVAFDEARKDPKINAALKKAAVGIALDGALTRLPGTGAFTMTRDIAQKAYDHAQAGDYAQAAKHYLATASVGLATVVPGGGDVTIEALRAAGMDLAQSPAAKTYNAITGIKLYCDKADAVVRSVTEHIPKPSDVELVVHAMASQGQLEALTAVITRVGEAYIEQNGRETLGTLPAPSVGQKPPEVNSQLRR
jgi:hypothetical protein